MKENGDGFTRCFLELNGIGATEFKNWVFTPGMLFESQRKWWKVRERRQRPHEGVDLCLYRTIREVVGRLEPGMFVPCLFSGEVISIIEDYMGNSIFVLSPPRQIWAFGHINVDFKLKRGKELEKGEPVGKVIFNEKNPIPSHIHVSLGVLLGSPPRKMDWSLMAKEEVIRLIDPMPYITYEYELLEDLDLLCGGTKNIKKRIRRFKDG